MAWSNANKAVLAMGLVAALLFPAPAASALSYDFHDSSCPNLLYIVYTAVDAARQADIGVVPGLLLLNFHDCFPQGCDGSILLTGPRSEQKMPQNAGLRQNALDLIESIREQVHRACGRTVSCADITNLAARAAVVQSGLPAYNVSLGRLDSLEPASYEQVASLPGPDLVASELVASFQSRGFSTIDLVALSGAHTVGKTSCGSIKNRFGENADFVNLLHSFCAKYPGRKVDLDVITPNTFDKQYFVNLINGNGVLNSDMALVRDDPAIKAMVQGFVNDQGWFFSQFSESMSKMAHLPPKDINKGEIRFSCSRRNYAPTDELANNADQAGLSASA